MNVYKDNFMQLLEFSGVYTWQLYLFYFFFLHWWMSLPVFHVHQLSFEGYESDVL